MKLLRLSRSRVFKIMAIIVIAIMVAVCAIPHFFTKVVYLDDHKYSKLSQDGDSVTYRTKDRVTNDVVVTTYPDRKEIIIEGEIYMVKEVQDTNEPTYSILYPNGKTYSAIHNGDMFMTYDEHGDLVPQSTFYVNDKRVLESNEERYLISQLVTAAYEQYQPFNGRFINFLMGIALFVYGWCGFRYEAFQRLLFNLSYSLWTKDAEPSDFYFAATKFAACVVMACGIWLGVKSL